MGGRRGQDGPREAEPKGPGKVRDRAGEDARARTAKRAYEQLVLVVPSAFLAIFRDKLTNRVLARIANVVERDYLHMDERKARQQLEEQLQAH